MATSSRDFVICGVCNLVVRPSSAFAAHSSSTEHLERTQGNFVRCPVCSLYCTPGFWSEHAAGKQHRKAAQRQGLRVDVPYEVPSSVPGHRKCQSCTIFVRDNQWESHQRSTSHLKRLRAQDEVDAMRETVRQATADKGGVFVSQADGVDFGVVDTSDAEKGVRTLLRVKTAPDSGNIKFVHAKILPMSSLASADSFSAPRISTSPIIIPDTEFYIAIHFHPVSPQLGQYSVNVEVLFQHIPRGGQFVIVRSVTAVVGSTKDYQAIAPVAPYQPRPRPKFRRMKVGNVIEGIRSIARHPYPTRLGHYIIPNLLVDALENGSQEVGQVIKRLPHNFRPTVLSRSNYATRLQAQLWAEEHKATLDMHVFDLFDQQLHEKGQTYHLAVPGLAESRPSVILGDSVLVQAQGSASDRWFEGVVHHVQRDAVGLRFARSFRFLPGATYSVRFTFNRIPLRRQHQALCQPFMQPRIFFPVKEHIKEPGGSRAQIELCNRDILGNTKQFLAVQTIVHLPPGAHPFVVFGPPGTGKTVTIVEAMLQLLKTNPTVKILACAPSNSAADLIAERLLEHVEAKKLFRLYAPSRSPESSKPIVLQCAYRPDGVTFGVPDAIFVSKYRVVVTTCVGAAFARNIKMLPGHFSHIFVDEAGQGTEAEAMVSIKGMASTHTNIILSGDPKQLRPVIRSSIAAELGLGKSYLERLMEREVYDEAQGHGRTLVKLVKNFRSHPRILEFPNQTFYGGDLQPHADPRVVDMFVKWKHHPRPNRRFPVVFHAISGNDEREASSPSYFNRLEASQVKSYVKMLLAGGNIASKDIGVITPYHAQAKKIRQLLEPLSKETQVASVELFQGQERKVIIMSTVRSTQDLMAYDLKHTLGFVGNPRRFNVAMTRAQALLIVVGDPAVLGLDPLWRSWLNFVFTNGGWTGSSGPSWNPEAEVREAGGYDREIRELGLEQMRALTARMEALSTGRNVVVEDDDVGVFEADARDEE